ncbi:uncharacterized protein [Hyperolius riggenbachi]|uniref:uncharacterized protein n=1 Tax=Hyperolius riggenbachi TaxID=752182 RepID=UPI0035A28F0D
MAEGDPDVPLSVPETQAAKTDSKSDCKRNQVLPLSTEETSHISVGGTQSDKTAMIMNPSNVMDNLSIRDKNKEKTCELPDQDNVLGPSTTKEELKTHNTGHVFIADEMKNNTSNMNGNVLCGKDVKPALTKNYRKLTGDIKSEKQSCDFQNESSITKACNTREQDTLQRDSADIGLKGMALLTSESEKNLANTGLGNCTDVRSHLDIKVHPGGPDKMSPSMDIELYSDTSSGSGADENTSSENKRDISSLLTVRPVDNQPHTNATGASKEIDESGIKPLMDTDLIQDGKLLSEASNTRTNTFSYVDEDAPMSIDQEVDNLTSKDCISLLGSETHNLIKKRGRRCKRVKKPKQRREESHTIAAQINRRAESEVSRKHRFKILVEKLPQRECTPKGRKHRNPDQSIKIRKPPNVVGVFKVFRLKVIKGMKRLGKTIGEGSKTERREDVGMTSSGQSDNSGRGQRGKKKKSKHCCPMMMRAIVALACILAFLAEGTTASPTGSNTGFIHPTMNPLAAILVSSNWQQYWFCPPNNESMANQLLKIKYMKLGCNFTFSEVPRYVSCTDFEAEVFIMNNTCLEMLTPLRDTEPWFLEYGMTRNGKSLRATRGELVNATQVQEKISRYTRRNQDATTPSAPPPTEGGGANEYGTWLIPTVISIIAGVVLIIIIAIIIYKRRRQERNHSVDTPADELQPMNRN